MAIQEMRLRDVPDEINELSRVVWAAAIEVHNTLGHALLESAYRRCLAHELRLRGVPVEEEVPLPLTYKDLVVDVAYRADLIVAGKIVVELKCVTEIVAEHEAQLMTYLHHSGLTLGLLYNMHAPKLRDGFRRRAVAHS